MLNVLRLLLASQLMITDGCPVLYCTSVTLHNHPPYHAAVPLLAEPRRVSAMAVWYLALPGSQL